MKLVVLSTKVLCGPGFHETGKTQGMRFLDHSSILAPSRGPGQAKLGQARPKSLLLQAVSQRQIVTRPGRRSSPHVA